MLSFHLVLPSVCYLVLIKRYRQQRAICLNCK